MTTRSTLTSFSSPRTNERTNERTRARTKEMADDSLVAQFTALTGAPAERARFFLDSAGGDVNVRLSLLRLSSQLLEPL